MAKKEALTGSEEVLTHIAEKVTEVLKQRGVDKGTVATAALAVSDGIAEQFGGQPVYFKKGLELTVEERHLAIRNDFATGHYSRSDLAAKYGVSLQWIYRILRDES